MTMWHRLKKEDGRAVLSGKQAKLPGKGVWVATLKRADGGQTTEEAIAVDGTIVRRIQCHCGYDRHMAFQAAEALLLPRKGEK